MTRDTINVLTPGLYPDAAGRAVCHLHASAHARFTGRDLNGAPVYPVAPGLAALLGVKCEKCQAMRYKRP